ncbi:hypothetical protein OOT33_03885 [Sphingobium sp. DEHP117]|jgi:rubrerythrin|uniref:hypothetical protein n=1 Tax=Sphingobium sp. DEHP117 TaxID=2993436 RepID=UPI0027D54E0D|nr:hypothetical protein [Sphingobium sp. DEHP117]MDQ4419580.1 hypothetical protein [Sphingobium sp. DEHP117]
MSGKLVSRRQRLVRVRDVQHTMAVAETVRARDEAASIEHNAQRVARVRADLFHNDRNMIGGTLAAYREMAERLERAGKQLEGALYDARKVVDYKQEMQVEASREKEIAERLKAQAAARAEATREARIAAIPPHKMLKMRMMAQMGDKE